MKKLDFKKLRKEKKIHAISTEESLKDIIPIIWSKEVLEGKIKIEVNNMK